MNSVTVLREILGAVDDAISLTEDAVKSAQEARQSQPQERIEIVKVAAHRYTAVAEALYNTGAFSGITSSGLAKVLEESSVAGLLDTMEKLASKAVFPLDASVLRGDLVEKTDASRVDLSEDPKTAMWQKAWREAESECAG